MIDALQFTESKYAYRFSTKNNLYEPTNRNLPIDGAYIVPN